MKNLTMLLEKQRELTLQRDKIQEQIGAVWDQVQQLILARLIGMGIFTKPWIYTGNMEYDSGVVLYLHDREIVGRVEEFSKTYKFQGGHLKEHDVYIYFQDPLRMKFGRKADVRGFLKKYGVQVDCSYVNDRILELRKEIERFDLLTGKEDV